MKPFFTYYGGKWRVAPKYPSPVRDQVIEPFGGAAGYSLRYADHKVWINDADPIVAGTWEYLTKVTEAEVLSLPDLCEGQTTDDLNLPQEARWLIGWWLNKGSSTPKKRPSSFMLKHPEGGPYWGKGVRQRIASQVAGIRHWRVTNCDYRDLPSGREATWFVDPPYEVAGKFYRYGSEALDFAQLAGWCRGLDGQVIVCEADQASWLPFTPLVEIDGTEGRQKKSRARTEVVALMGAI